MSNFIGSNLRTARLFHGLSLQDLADRVGRSKQFLSRLEAGIEYPNAVLIADLSNALQVYDAFFLTPDPMPITDEQCHFRKQLTTKVALRQVARARGDMLKRLVNVFEQNLDLPKYDFVESEPLSLEHIEKVAEECRHRWDLGLGPIQKMTRVAENAGAVVLQMPGLASEIDAISFATSRPVIGLNAEGRSACRARFALAHEIGHFCLHIGIQTGDKLSETQANRFASAFLMPRRYFIVECQRALRASRLNWPAISEMKMRWGVSKAAILYRGRQLGVFSEDQYRSGVIGLNRHGQAKREDEDDLIPMESPEVINDGFEVLLSAFGMSRAVVASSMNVEIELLDSLVTSLPRNFQHTGNVVPFQPKR
nr:XRE family transcriptional regulator [uncultured Noviherbaspirillum sp.]